MTGFGIPYPADGIGILECWKGWNNGSEDFSLRESCHYTIPLSMPLENLKAFLNSLFIQR
jgi:hypothetical protein